MSAKVPSVELHRWWEDKSRVRCHRIIGKTPLLTASFNYMYIGARWRTSASYMWHTNYIALSAHIIPPKFLWFPSWPHLCALIVQVFPTTLCPTFLCWSFKFSQQLSLPFLTVQAMRYYTWSFVVLSLSLLVSPALSAPVPTIYGEKPGAE